MEYIIKNNTLTGIRQAEETVHIPEGVTILEANVFNALPETKTVHFPKSLTAVTGCGTFLFRHQENVFVHPENPAFADDDGVLYDKDRETLLCCPMGRRGTYRTLPSTRAIGADAFCCSQLDGLHLNEGLESIGPYAFSDAMGFHSVEIPASVREIHPGAFLGEYFSIEPVVIRDSYAQLYAEQYHIRYHCKPLNCEAVWNEHAFLRDFDSAQLVQDWNRLRALRKSVFLSTVTAVEQGGYLTADGHRIQLYLTPDIAGQTLFYDSEIHPARPDKQYDTQVRVVHADCLAHTRKLCRIEDEVCVLNMASRQNPGGGVYTGAGAQEEYLFRCTDYYRSLFQYAPYASLYGIEKAPESYPLDRDFGGCFSRGVTVFRGTEEEGYRFLNHPWKVNFIAVPGMNRPATTFVDGEECINDTLVEGVKNKMRTIFRIAMANHQKTLVLGALGCGALRNPPKHTARLFQEVMAEEEFQHVFRRIIFAIKEDHNSRGRNLEAFREVFGTSPFPKK